MRRSHGLTVLPAPDERPYYHITSTGQSLCEGTEGTPVLTTGTATHNRMFSGGLAHASGSGLGSFVSFTAGSVESIHCSLSEVIEAGYDNHDLILSQYARGGKTYAQMAKGTAYYTELTTAVTAGYNLAVASGRDYSVPCVLLVHGESDHLAGTATYAADLATWQDDLQTDIQAITGQTETIPLIQSQMSNWTYYSDATSLIPYAQMAATLASGGKIWMVGPKYNLPHSDGLHLTNHGYRQHGEYFAKAYAAHIASGTWSPLYPTTVARTGAQILITFNVPVAPLVLDDTLVSDPGSYGFEYTDDGTPPAISSVELVGTTQVRVTLASTPTGANKRIRYAYTGTPGASGGPTTGPRGCLRDSDATASLYGYELFNWCVHFDEAAT